MSDEQHTGFTVSFRPGGKDYDSPLVVIRANTVEDLLVKLDANPDEDDLGSAVGSYHDKLRRQFEDAAGVSVATVIPISHAPSAPIWEAGGPGAVAGPLTPNPDGTYPACPHGHRPRKPWTSPRNGKRYLFCALDKGAPGACPTVTL